MVALLRTEGEAGCSPTLFEIFQSVPDPRDARGRRYPLPGLLTLTTTAMLCGYDTLQSVSESGRARRGWARALGFQARKMPCTGVFHYLFKALDPEWFGGALTVWWQRNQGSAVGGLRLNLDGKSARGSHDGALPCAHLLSVYSETAQTAIAQLRVDLKTNEHKAALALLQLVPLEGALVTGDAAFAQRDLSQAILEAGGHYLWAVKDNQPALHAALQGAFEAPFPPGRPGDVARGSALRDRSLQGTWAG